MTLEQIHQEAETFFEWPTDQHIVVTLTSAELFARHIAEKMMGCSFISEPSTHSGQCLRRVCYPYHSRQDV